MSTETSTNKIHQGKAGEYFGSEYESLPSDLPAKVIDAGNLLTNQDLNYLGKLTCSQFSNIDTYVYVNRDRTISVSVMVDEKGLSEIDCVSKFADASFLTTTTVQIIPNAYDEQKLFRVSFPQLNAEELLQQHRDYVTDFAAKYGEVQVVFADLSGVAQIVDEYVERQEANPGHDFLAFAGGFAQASIAQMMTDNDDEIEDWDEEEYDEDAVEYDLKSVSPLIKAILQEDLAQVQTLLASGVEVNPSQSWDDEVPFVAAVYQGNMEIIQALIDAGANVDQLDLNVDSRPLGMAIRQNRLDLVELLLNNGVSPEGGGMSETALAIAIRKNNLPIVKMLLEAGADPNTPMEDDYRAIMEASFSGNLEIVKLLVDYGADVNAWSQGETAIMMSLTNGHQEIYEYLYPMLDQETRRYVDKHGQAEFKKAVKRQERLENKLGEKLGDAAVFGKLTKVKQLLEEGADPNSITECGKSPLMLAAMYGHLEVMDALLDAGADPNLQGDEESDEGMTALMYITDSFFASNRAEAIQFLIDRGADPNIQDEQGRTALTIAAISNSDAVKALIDNGADPDLRDKDGNTAMMLGDWSVQQLLRKVGASEEGMDDVALVKAVHQGKLTKVQELVQSGANVNYSDGNALVSAAQRGYLEIVKYLILAGADVNLGWKNGFTAIASAAYDGYASIVECLLEAGADPWQKCHDEESFDALEYAQTGLREGNNPDRDYQTIIDLLTQIKED